MVIQLQDALRTMSATDFASFGLNELAYVKPTLADGQPAYSVHAADGTALTVVSDRDLALAVIRHNEMEALSAH